jgi:hypothetical protein
VDEATPDVLQLTKGEREVVYKAGWRWCARLEKARSV